MIDNTLQAKKRMLGLNLRQKTIITLAVSAVFLIVIAVWGSLIGEDSYGVDFAVRNSAPSTAHIFGTDWMERNYRIGRASCRERV